MKQNHNLVVAYAAEGAILGYRIVAHGEESGGVKQATAATDKLLGVTTRMPKDPGEHTDVVRSGLTPVVYGDTLKRGDFVTTDNQGRAVKATNQQMYVGIAEEDGEADDIGSIFVAFGTFASA